MKNIVVITDCYDVAFNEIRTKIIEILGDRIDEVSIEPVVKVKEFSLINCCFLTRLMAENYPEGTAFLVLCSPTIEKPNRIYGVTKKKKLLFFGPNNGVLTWLIKDFGVEEIYISENRSDKEYHPFGGKIDYAPTIAKMILVENLKSLTIGREAKIDEIKTLEIPDGSIVHIDNFGSCKIKGNLPHIKEGSRVKIDINGKFIYATFCKRMMSLPDNTYVLYPGSSLTFPEFGLVRGNASKLLDLNIGDVLSWSIENENKN